jgi:hypothetical protein
MISSVEFLDVQIAVGAPWQQVLVYILLSNVLTQKRPSFDLNQLSILIGELCK